MFKALKKPNFRLKHSRLAAQLLLQLLCIVFIIISLIFFVNSQFIADIYINHSKANLKKLGKSMSDLTINNESFFLKVNEIKNKQNYNFEIYDPANDILIYSSTMRDILYAGDNNIAEDFNEFFKHKMLRREMTVLSQEYERDEEGGFFSEEQDPSSKVTYIAYTSYMDTGEFVKIYIQKDAVVSTAVFASKMLDVFFFVFALFIGIILFWYVRHFTKPLIELNQVTRNMAQMDFTKKCEPRINNEIGELAKNINFLSDSLDKTLHTLKEKNIQLEADIEFERKMEHSRKEFVSNVSHELKTPIAIIQGYAEGLKIGVNDNPEIREEYCNIIIDESMRMNKLVLDLLELSHYESGFYKLNEEKFSIHRFIADFIYTQTILLEDNDIQIDIAVNPQFIGYGDIQKLDMVLNNYMSNAISHCTGDRTIRIRTAERTDSYRVFVFNSGNHIEQDDLEELWNSFYRGDKSRQREKGRFGLGLSIVKAIQELHKMAYGVTNVDNGVEFWFDIQKYKE